MTKWKENDKAKQGLMTQLIDKVKGLKETIMIIILNKQSDIGGLN